MLRRWLGWLTGIGMAKARQISGVGHRGDGHRGDDGVAEAAATLGGSEEADAPSVGAADTG